MLFRDQQGAKKNHPPTKIVLVLGKSKKHQFSDIGHGILDIPF